MRISSEATALTKASFLQKVNHNQKLNSDSAGFSLPEALIALSAGTLIIGASAVALQSTQTLIRDSGQKVTQRQNIVNGVRLMRSEIERSIHVIVNGVPPSPELSYTDLSQYKSSVDQCKELAGEEFIPLFGLRMSDVTGDPVMYGIGQGSNSKTFAIKRCGRILALDGRYDNNQTPFVATVIDGIRMMPCLTYDNSGECISNPPIIPGQDSSEVEKIKAEDILAYLSSDTQGFYHYGINSEHLSPSRNYLEPAFRLETDESRKLIRVVAPMDCNQSNPDAVCVETTQISVRGSSDAGSYQPLELTAYARADKRLLSADDESTNLGGDWFRDVNSDYVRFLVDGSGSMSACMAWSYDTEGELEIGDTERIFHTPEDDPLYDGSSYEVSRAICHETRMERLQSELTELLLQLPGDTKISLEVFSTSTGNNNRQWERSANGLVSLGDGDNRDSALAFVQSLDDPAANTWGGTDPWAGLQRSFDDPEADSLYFLSDGLPTETLSIHNGSNASYYNNYITAAAYFASQNANREKPLTVHSTAVKLNSEWMKELSDQTSGNYLQSQ